MPVAGEQEEQRVTAELEEAAARGVGEREQPPKQVSTASVTSSAPSLPCRARRSDIFVNPEMSTKSSEPSTVATPGLDDSTSSLARAQSRVSRGT